MDDRYLCPDCSAEHSEPLEATLGHLALCLTCAVAAEGLHPTQPVSVEPLFLEIHIAA